MTSQSADERPVKRLRLSQDPTVHNGSSVNTAIEPQPENDPLNTIMSDSKETEVGITAYVSKQNKSFSALLKTRYTDFMVNEILPNGQVVHLTSTKVPDLLHPSNDNQPDHKVQIPPTDKKTGSAAQSETQSEKVVEVNKETTNGEIEDTSTEADTEAHKISEEDKQKLISYLNEPAFRQLLSLYQSVLTNPGKKSKDHPLVRTEFTSDRSLRGEIHSAIRQIFQSKIDSSTDTDGTLVLTAANPNSRYNRPSHNNNNTNTKSNWRPGKLGWQERGGEYLHFTLYKENKDTMESISWLTRTMKINAKIFQFAGTKDKRAVTSQRVSAYRMDAERLAAQNRTLRNAAVGDFVYHPQGLELGDLTGNEFTITLRDCQLSDTNGLPTDEKMVYIKSTFQTALSNLASHGFLNYYGLQRFGTFASRTDATGLHILKGDFQAACDLILEYDVALAETPLPTDRLNAKSSDDQQRAHALRNYSRDNNLHKALEMLPRRFSAESTLLRHLHKQPTDCLGALMTIPRNLRLMYVHAYQSLVWNNAATHRWNLHGDQVVEGDLVLVHEHKDKISKSSEPSNLSNTYGSDAAQSGEMEVDADGEPVFHPPSHDRANTTEDMFERAHPLSAAEASSGQYTIFDLVLPLPGYDIIYPSGDDFYKNFMKENGNLDPNDMRRKQKDFSLSGSYRKILARVKLGEGADGVDVYKYRKDDEQFVKTDMELLKEKPGGVTDGGKPKDRGWGEMKSEKEMKVNNNNDDVKIGGVEKEEEGDDKNEKIAAVLKFQLGSSQYATIALRELSHGGIVAYKADFGNGR